MKEVFNVLSICPFWRYAVCPEQNDIPGIPFYTLAAATAFFESTCATLDWAPCYLIKRGFWNNRVSIYRSYKARLNL